MTLTGQLEGISVGTAVLDHWYKWNAVRSRGRGRGTETDHDDRRNVLVWHGQATVRAIGMLHFAAAGGYPDAYVVLGLRSVFSIQCTAQHSTSS